MIKNKIVYDFIKKAKELSTEDRAAFDAMADELGEAMGYSGADNYPITYAKPGKGKLKHHMWDTTDISEFNVDPTDPAKMSQMLGRAKNKSTMMLRPVHTAVSWVPLYSGAVDLYDTYHDNSTSWKAIQKAYKDDPEILGLFKNLRDKELGAELKYKASYILPRLLVGSYLGYKGYNRASKWFDKEKNPILHNLAKYGWGATSAIFGYGLGGLADKLTGLSSYYGDELKSIKNSAEYKNMSKRLNDTIISHKNKKK